MKHSELKAPTFSRRTSWDTTESDWARVLRDRREAGQPIFDLTVSNPTHCGFDYDTPAILAALTDPAAMDYDPDPHGMLRAREAVCQYYVGHDAAVAPDKLFLTTSTSEAYSFLFRLLCDPGDEVLIAQPSYPLFDFLADLDDVRLVSYPLFYDYGWQIDMAALRQRIGPRTRAIVVVNPNNPTGHFTRPGERLQLEAICSEHGLALIVDEVFLDYAVDRAAKPPSFAAEEHPALTFVLSGLSKIAALPQMKVSWIVCLGPSASLAAAMERLEVIADTFLSMNAPTQLALPAWLAGRFAIQGQIRARAAANLETLDRLIGEQPEMGAISRLQVEAGWSAVLRVPALQPDAMTAYHLLRLRGIAVHSGDLYEFPASGFLVVSLLTPQRRFVEGIEGIRLYLKDLCL